MHLNSNLIYIARTNAREPSRIFGMSKNDRRAHMYVVGRTGTGKSSLFETLAFQDIRNGHGLALLDPHGDLAERLLKSVSSHLRSDLTYFDVPDIEQPVTFNPLASIPLLKRPLVGANLLEVFKKIWTDSWGVRMEHLLRYSLLTLLDQPCATLGDLLPLLDDEDYRTEAIRHVTNEQVRRFWLQEYNNYPLRYRADAAAPIQNKVGAFLADPLLNRILTSKEPGLDLRKIMDEGKILLVNLAKGKIGEGPASLLGSLLVAQFGAAGLSRADTPENHRRDFYLYLDEFQTFTTQSLAGMLSELRKYRVNLILANQYLSQIDRVVLDGILGNVGTIISFRVGPVDAEFLAKEFAPVFKASDLMNLPNYHIYLKLMIDGAVSPPFSATTITVKDLENTACSQRKGAVQ